MCLQWRFIYNHIRYLVGHLRVSYVDRTLVVFVRQGFRDFYFFKFKMDISGKPDGSFQMSKVNV